MAKSIFISGTGTDIGKTYVSALIVKELRENGLDAGYYKPVMSGVSDEGANDVERVVEKAKLKSVEECCSYSYDMIASPHLASLAEGNPVELEKVQSDYALLAEKYQYLTVEGAGGIICPLRYDDTKIMQHDIVKALDLNVLLVANAGLGTINSTVLTAEYLKANSVRLAGIILNQFDENSALHKDNLKMVEDLINVPVVATVGDGGNLQMRGTELTDLYY